MNPARKAWAGTPAAPFGASRDLIIRPLPFSTAPPVEALWWHPTRERDPAHVCLRDVRRGIARY